MAKIIQKKINTGSKILVTSTNDPRSYRQNSDRIIKEGFLPQKSIKIL